LNHHRRSTGDIQIQVRRQESFSYRPDIDGLRGVAVLAVLFFHAFPIAAPGGFVGVDIFFVISGFLISNIILSDLDAGSFSLARFYEKRLRRIFPALIAVLSAVLGIGWALLLSDEFTNLGKHVGAGAAFVSNMVFWREVGYFDIAADLKPLLHLWSLAVEEQFYLVWPAVLMLLARRTKIGWGIAAILASSFAFNVLVLNHRPVAAFFLAPSRFWELMTGAVVAHWNAHPRFSARWPGNVLSALGLTGIVWSVESFHRALPYPGWRSIIPVASTACLIAAGPEAWSNHRLLSVRALVYIGRISYPLYLWHWPLLSFLRILQHEPSTLYRWLAAVAAFALSMATYHLIELPIRFNPARLVPITLLVGIAIPSVAGTLAAFGCLQGRLQGQGTQVVEARGDWAYPLMGSRLDGEPVRSLGNGHPRVLFIGDSHIEQYWPRAEEVLARGNAGSVAFITGGGCAPIPSAIATDHPHCTFFNKLGALAAHVGADRVVVGGMWYAYLDGETAFRMGPSSEFNLGSGTGRALGLQLLGRALRSLTERGVSVTLLLPIPTGPEFDPGQMLVRTLAAVEFQPHPMEREPFDMRHRQNRERLIDMARESGANVIDPVEFLCDTKICATID
jgi:peptidoglycan/LPS O-acetylase OafA/YrhL